MPLDANIYTEITSLDDALDKLFKALDAARESSGQDRLPQAMTRPTAQAEGSVLCAPVVAARPFPPFALAAASGYALKAADTYAATDEAPATLQEGKTCFAVSSGDALPPSCDAVALSAHAAVDGKGGISITAPMLPWLHVRRVGSDIAAGEALFCRNHILRPSDIGALLAAGVDEVQVWDRLEVFLATVGGNYRPARVTADGAATGTGTGAADGTPGAAAGAASAPTSGAATGATPDTRLVDGISPALAARTQALDCRAHLAAPLEQAAVVVGVALQARGLDADPSQGLADLPAARGGAGALHACSVARELGMKHVIIPQNPGALCAVGLVNTDLMYDFSKTEMQLSTKVKLDVLDEDYRMLEEEAESRLLADHMPEDKIVIQRVADCRYEGQGYEMRVPVIGGKVTEETIEKMKESFHQLHKKQFGRSFRKVAVEIVNIRVIGTGSIEDLEAVKIPQGTGDISAAQVGEREVTFKVGDHPEHFATKVYDRSRFCAGDTIPGPAVINQMDTTIVIEPGCTGHVNDYGIIIIDIDA